MATENNIVNSKIKVLAGKENNQNVYKILHPETTSEQITDFNEASQNLIDTNLDNFLTTEIQGFYLPINDNAVSATKLKNSRNINVSDADGTNTGTAISFNGTANGMIKLPSTIKATLTGNADSATKLQSPKNIAISGGATGTATAFDGTKDITIPITALDATVLEGTASIDTTGNAATATQLKNSRSINISDADETNTGTAISFNGTSAGTIKLPSTIKATLTGNASSATKLQTARNINISDADGTNTGTAISFNGTSAGTIKLPSTIKATLTGNASSATKATQDSSGNNIVNTYAPKASPALTGTPTAPTAEAGTATTQIATTEFVNTAINNLIGTAPETLDTLEEIANAINNDKDVYDTLTNAVASKQDKHAALTSISGLATSADKMIYTTASNTYTTTPLTSFARTLLDDADASTARTTLDALGKTEKAASAEVADSAAECTGNAATATQLKNSRSINISDADETNTGTAISFNGTSAGTIKLPSTIKATLTGNASSATKATNDSDNNAINTTYAKLSGATFTGNVSGTTETLSGTLTLSKTTALSGTANNSPALIVGGTNTSTHIEMDSANIQAKKNGTTVAELSLNKDGGLVNIGAGGLSVAGNIDATGQTITASTFSGNASTATKLQTARNINVSDADSTNTGTAFSFNGTSAGTIKLPSTIKATLTGNADSATKLETTRNINVSDADGTNTGTAISFNGTAAGTIKLPSTIKATLTGNASSATNDSAGKKISEHTVEYITGTQTAATASWTGVTKDPALYTGKIIVYKLPYASASNATLNLTLSGGGTTGAIAIYRYNTTRMSTEYAANYYVPLVYNGQYWFAFADYDTNQIDRIRSANTIAIADGSIAATKLIGTVDGNKYIQLAADSVIDINYPILYNTSAVSNGAGLSTSLYWVLSGINLQTIVADTNRTWDIQKPLYLKGTLNDNNFTIHSDIITTTIPTTEDGFVYIFIGYTYSTYQANINLLQQQKFAYKNGSFIEFIPNYLTITDAANTYAPKVSPALTGTPTAPTAATTTNNTQIATTAFVQAAAKAANTDTKVTNTLGATTKAYITGTTAATTNTGTQIFDTGVYLSATAGELVATKFTGVLNGNANTATKATQDAAGNVITDTYSTKANTIKDLSINGKTITYTKDDNTTGTLTTQDTTYSAATSSTLGLVKIGSNITNSNGTISLTKDNVTTALGYTPPTSDTNTHYTTKLIASASTGTVNAVTTNGNTYLRLFDDTTARNSINIKGSGATTVTSDANGVITISSTDNNTTYSTATTSIDGLMSSTDKSKLDGIQANATAVSFSQTKTSGTEVGKITINGTTTTLYSDTNTDTNTKVTNTLGTTIKAYITGTTTATTNTGTQIFDTGVYLSTTAGELVATKFTGALNGNANTATKATQDASGNVITDTYSTKANTIKDLSINGKTITYTKGDDTTGTLTTQDTTYSAATSSTLGLVKIGSNITNSNGTISLTKDNVTTALGYTPPTSDTNTHYTTKLIAGASTSTVNTATTNGNTYIRLFDDTTARNSINIKGSGSTTVTSDANGVITINSTDNNTDTKVTNTLGTTTKAYITGTTAATTNTGSQIFDTGVYLSTTAGELVATKFTGALNGNANTATSATKATQDASGNVITDTYSTKANTIKSLSISGTTITYTKGDDTTGTLTTQDTNTDTHYTTKLIAGGSAATANAAVTSGNVYLRLFDNTTARNNIQLKPGSNMTITSDANGIITFAATNTTYSAATTSADGLMSSTDKSKLDGIQASATAVSIARSLTSGTKVGTITINGTATDLYCQTNTDTHYTTKLIAGASNGTVNAATTNGNTYLRLFDNTTARNSINIKGSGATTVTSDANGVITINSTDNNTTYSAATTSADGLMSSTDKSKLDGIQSGATTVSFTQTKTSGTEVGTITINGTATKLYCDTNTDTNTKVTQTNSTAATAYPILLKNGTGTGSVTNTVLFASGITLTPSTGTITATKFGGALTGNVTGNVSGSSGSCTGNAATATKATQDGSGNTITSYYTPRTNAASVSLALANWAQNTSEGTKYQWYYDISVTGLTANDIVTVNIPRASKSIADAAEILDTNESSAGSVRIFAKRKPSAAFTVYYHIHKGTA